MIANPIQAIVIIVPQYIPASLFTTPIKNGEGKSPIKCMENIDTATACGLSSSSTLDMSPTFAGPSPLNISYKKSKNSAAPKQIKKNTNGPSYAGPPMVGPITAPTMATQQATAVTIIISLQAFSAL